MARRYDHKPKELRELAIESGLKIIKNEGLAGFSTRKVAADIEYTVGTIHNIFGNYDGFILHINARTLDNWYEYLEKAAKIYKGEKPIHNLAKHYIQYAAENYNEWLTLFQERDQGKKQLPKWYKSKLIKFFATVEELLPESMAGHRSAKVLWASIHGITILSLSGKLDLTGTESAQVLANNLIDNYLY